MFPRPYARRALGNLASVGYTGQTIRSRAVIGPKRFSTGHAFRAASALSDMTSNQPEEGATAIGVFKVLPTDLASVISPDPNDVYPPVLATARLTAFMEIVCARMLVPHLAPGQLSVGVQVDLLHTAATAVHDDVNVQATFRGKQGKLFAFDVIAKDAGGEIGKAMHTRAMVDQERLMGGVQKRIGSGSKV